MKRTDLKALTQDTYCDIQDRMDRATTVLIFLSNAVGKMLEDAEHIPRHADNNFGAHLTFSWLITEMKGILESLEGYSLVKQAEKSEATR